MSKTTIHVPEHIYEWAKGVAFLGLTRGFVLARGGAECPPPPDGDEVSLVLDAAGPAPVPEVAEGAARAEALRDAADMVEARFKVKQPHKNLWLEIVGAIRALANKAEKSASRKRDRALVRAGIVDILQPTDGRPVEVASTLAESPVDHRRVVVRSILAATPADLAAKYRAEVVSQTLADAAAIVACSMEHETGCLACIRARQLRALADEGEKPR